ncbi:MAG TPA: nuclear transport factor 2 family protein [Steroidobacteraceae bacterium]|nr:nuclear transport factor 2 family protein [Steroidobacteraceae bacterium]
MARIITLLVGSALTISALAAYPTPVQAASSSAADKAAIEALEARFAAAFEAKDVDAIMRVYLPGPDLFVFDVTPPRQHVGSSDYKADWEDTFRATRGPVHFSISDLSVTVVGRVAYGHSIQRVSFTRADGSKADFVVRVSDVYRKTHGRWLIVQEHVSVPVDLNTGKADLLSKP